MSAPEVVSIEELLKRVKNGDRPARVQLFAMLGDEKQFGRVVLAMARKLLPRGHPARRLVDTHDIVQSALRTGLRNFSDFRGESEGELYGWLRAIIRSKVNRVARRQGKNVDLENLDDVQKKAGGGEPSLHLSSIIDRELRELLHRAIGELPLSQRLVVELRLRGVNSAAIGRMLGLKPATVRKRESRAVERLKALCQ